MAEEKEFNPKKIDMFAIAASDNDGAYLPSSGSARDFVDEQARITAINTGSAHSLSQLYKAPDGIMQDMVPPHRRTPGWDARDTGHWLEEQRASGKTDSMGNPLPDMLTAEQREWLEAGGSIEGHDNDLSKELVGKLTPAVSATPWNLFGGEFENGPAMGTEEKFSLIALAQPGVAKAIAASGMKASDVATVYNYAVAQTASSLANEYVDNGNPVAAAQVLSALPIPQRIIAAAILDDTRQAKQREATDAAYERRQREIQGYHDWKEEQKLEGIVGVDPVVDPNNPVPAKNDGVYKYEDPYTMMDALGAVIDFTLLGVENVTHVARASTLMLNETLLGDRNYGALVTPASGEAQITDSFASRLGAVWQATTPGFISQQAYNELSEKYGRQATSTMLAYYQATQEEDPAAMQEFYASIQDDPVATSLITSAWRGENVGGDQNNGAELFVQIAAKDTGNYGNIIASPWFGANPDSLPFTVARDTANVVSWLAFDPLTYTFGAGQAIKASKYGLAAAMHYGGGSFSKGMATMLRAEKLDHGVIGLRWMGRDNGVREIYEEFGKAAQELKALRNDPTKVAEAARKEAQINRRFFKGDNAFFTQDDLRFAMKDGNELFDAESWARYYDSIYDAEQLLLAKPVALPAMDASKSGKAFLEQFGQVGARGAEVAEANFALAGAQKGAEVLVHEGFDSLVGRLAVAQQAGRKMYVPHSSSARQYWSNAYQKATAYRRGRYEREVANVIEALGRETDGMSLKEIEEYLTRKLSTDIDFAKEFGEKLTVFKFENGKMVRTRTGRVMDKLLTNHPNLGRALGHVSKTIVDQDEVLYRKKGWKKQGNFFTRNRESMSKMVQRIPRTPDGLITNTGEHAEQIYLFARAANMNHMTASMLRASWAGGTEAQRQNMAIGLVQSFTRAMGINAVDPRLESKILEQMTGLTWKEIYAPTQVFAKAGVYRSMRAEAAQRAQNAEQFLNDRAQAALDAQLADLQEQLARAVAGRKKRSHIVKQIEEITAKAEKERAAGVKRVNADRVYQNMLKAERRRGADSRLEPNYNPSVGDETGRSAALYLGQTTDRISIPSFQAMDNWAARSSMLNSLLFQNSVGKGVTDMWVLGTLAGPRFQLRNGLEDAGMYALTRGSIPAMWRGRRLGQVIDANVARVNRDYLVQQDNVRNAEKALKKAQRESVNGQGDDVMQAEANLVEAQRMLDKAQKAKTLYGQLKIGKHTKLGVVRTQIVNMSEKATYKVDGEGVVRVRDGLVSKLAQWLVPTTSSWERAAAAQQGREAAAELAAKAVLRNKFVYTNKGWKKFIPNRAKSYDDLTDAQKQYYKYEKELLESNWGLQLKDEAAESAQHYADGAIPTLDSKGRYVLAPDGTVLERLHTSKGYSEIRGAGTQLNDRQAAALAAKLRFVADKYSLNQAALHQIPRYHEAVNAGGAHARVVEGIISDVLRTAREGRDWPLVAERFRLVDELGAREHVRRMLDDMTDLFSGPEGQWNQKLWRSLRKTDEKGKWYFTAEDVTEAKIIEGGEGTAFDAAMLPERLVARVGDEGLLVPAGNKGMDRLSVPAWDMMGRSLARMTRNPIWYGNYIEARKQFALLESRYAKIFGDKWASHKFTELAAERAYDLTMAWVDNPAIRSNLAWQVRNIARYYRAQEDFARRMMRMVKYDPAAVQKANLAWQAQHDFGFVHKDQYGDEYFIYPGSAAVMGVLGNLFGGAGVGEFKYAASPLALGGKTMWLSPSLDPQSWMPTVSSPWMAVTLQPLLRLLPMSRDVSRAIEARIFGEMSANMDYTNFDLTHNDVLDTLLGAGYGTLPPNFKKLISVFPVVELEGGYREKAMMKAVMGMAAAGLLPEGSEWSDENVRRETLEGVDRWTTANMVFMLGMGLVAPASPQLMQNDVSLAAREGFYESLNPALQAAIRASTESGEDYQAGLNKWLADNPKDAMFVVGKREVTRGAAIAPTDRNVAFLKENEERYEEDPLGMSFLTPERVGTAGSDGALAEMKYFDIYNYKTVEDFLADVVNAEGKLVAAEAEAELEAMRASTMKYDPQTGDITDAWKRLDAIEDGVEIDLDALYPERDQGMGAHFDKTETSYRVNADKVIETVFEFEGKSDQADALLPLAEAYLIIRRDYDANQRNSAADSYSDDKTRLGEIWRGVIIEWWETAQYSYDEDRALRFAKLLTNSMNKGWKNITLEGGQ